MFAIAALIVFILGLVLRLFDVGDSWVLLFLGLACLAAHAVFAWTPWNRNP
jgi:hypothetical protein